MLEIQHALRKRQECRFSRFFSFFFKKMKKKRSRRKILNAGTLFSCVSGDFF